MGAAILKQEKKFNHVLKIYAALEKLQQKKEKYLAIMQSKWINASFEHFIFTVEKYITCSVHTYRGAHTDIAKFRLYC